ncbi:MAG: hypothetical protein GEU28_03115 [Dehalococcoidia bacterium]|nr:hypothetical protein [Dehalococcoidia bacterium]
MRWSPASASPTSRKAWTPSLRSGRRTSPGSPPRPELPPGVAEWGSRREDQTVKHVGLIGHPVAHSVSARFQQAAFDAFGIDARYEAWDTLPEGLGQRIEGLRGEDFLGANVTVPHKEAAATAVDVLDPVAEAVGAINTIVNDGGVLTG